MVHLIYLKQDKVRSLNYNWTEQIRNSNLIFWSYWFLSHSFHLSSLLPLNWYLIPHIRDSYRANNDGSDHSFVWYWWRAQYFLLYQWSLFDCCFFSSWCILWFNLVKYKFLQFQFGQTCVLNCDNYLSNAGLLFTAMLWVSCRSLCRYASLCASSLVQQLRKEDDIYIRPLGNVIYIMCGPCTPQDSCTRQLLKVHHRLCELNWAGWEYSWWEQTFGVWTALWQLKFQAVSKPLHAVWLKTTAIETVWWDEMA